MENVKESYEALKMETIEFEEQDVLTESNSQETRNFDLLNL